MKDDASKLISEGFRSYLDAMVALRKFRHDLQSVLEESFRKRLPELTHAFDVEVLAQEISQNISPDDPSKQSWKGDDAWIAVYATIDSFGWPYASVYWWDNDGTQQVDACVGIEAASRPIFDRSLELLRATPSTHRLESGRPEIWVASVLSSEAPGELMPRIDELLREWIRLWESIGGISAVARAQKG